MEGGGCLGGFGGCRVTRVILAVLGVSRYGDWGFSGFGIRWSLGVARRGDGVK